ncbi:extracellular matrix regulator RemB [Alkalihalobacterium alkalinitrilicum]|uniref:extracellular matrix regulator RemB n=1 Tax=Alkalihalobacterium alkalinitrilicum TaxID=427920 RepID=UPI000994F995|nr:extracellular matrix/biofilm biosynthesis regulator RemA family protein [Alkalihalobacterium alkalinitrilicum]
MFIHLGGDIVIRSKDVVAILNSDMKESSGITKEFINAHFKANYVFEISEEMTKSIVITNDQVYYSPISSVTLKRRAQVVSELDSYTD